MRNRRRLLAAACGAAALGGCDFTLEHGVANPCRAALPRSLARDDAVLAAWEGIDATRLWDCHAHLAGIGDSDSGIWLNPDLLSVGSPLQCARRLFFLNAGCAHDAPGRVDQSYVDHGVRVVMAHCATMGQDRDLDRGQHGPYLESFALFARLMEDARYGGNLRGDISAVSSSWAWSKTGSRRCCPRSASTIPCCSTSCSNATCAPAANASPRTYSKPGRFSTGS